MSIEGTLKEILKKVTTLSDWLAETATDEQIVKGYLSGTFDQDVLEKRISAKSKSTAFCLKWGTIEPHWQHKKIPESVIAAVHELNAYGLNLRIEE